MSPLSRRSFLQSAVCGGLASALPARAQPAEGKYQPTWESLQQYVVPDWYRDAKFGIFLHWGVYSVPAYSSEWYPREMYLRDSDVFKYHRARYGPQCCFGYKDFIPKFTAAQWDPERWVALFRSAGAKYVVPVAEHHDGFPMYACSYTRWNAVRMGPRRDVVGQLSRAVRAAGLRLGVSSHRAFNWSYYTFEKDFDTSNPAYSGLYGKPHPPAPKINNNPDELRQRAPREFIENWFGRTVELADKYQPDLFYFDFGFEAPEYEPYRKRFAAHFYNRAQSRGRGVVINYKHEAYPRGAAVLDIERGVLDHIPEHYWQTDTSVGWNSWGFIKDEKYKSATDLLPELIDIVSKNGCLLLNVGPRPDGTIPEPAAQTLRDMGTWLVKNGEAIYGTRPWKTYGEGPTRLSGGYFGEKPLQFTPKDIRFTSKGSTIYAIVLAWPQQQLTIESLGTRSNVEVSDVRLLGADDRLEFKQNDDALVVRTPERQVGEYAYVFRIA